MAPSYSLADIPLNKDHQHTPSQINEPLLFIKGQLLSSPNLSIPQLLPEPLLHLPPTPTYDRAIRNHSLPSVVPSHPQTPDAYTTNRFLNPPPIWCTNINIIRSPLSSHLTTHATDYKTNHFSHNHNIVDTVSTTLAMVTPPSIRPSSLNHHTHPSPPNPPPLVTQTTHHYVHYNRPQLTVSPTPHYPQNVSVCMHAFVGSLVPLPNEPTTLTCHTASAS